MQQGSKVEIQHNSAKHWSCVKHMAKQQHDAAPMDHSAFKRQQVMWVVHEQDSPGWCADNIEALQCLAYRYGTGHSQVCVTHSPKLYIDCRKQASFDCVAEQPGCDLACLRSSRVLTVQRLCLYGFR